MKEVRITQLQLVEGIPGWYEAVLENRMNWYSKWECWTDAESGDVVFQYDENSKTENYPQTIVKNVLRDNFRF